MSNSLIKAFVANLQSRQRQNQAAVIFCGKLDQDFGTSFGRVSDKTFQNADGSTRHTKTLWINGYQSTPIYCDDDMAAVVKDGDIFQLSQLFAITRWDEGKDHTFNRVSINELPVDADAVARFTESHPEYKD